MFESIGQPHFWGAIKEDLVAGAINRHTKLDEHLVILYRHGHSGDDTSTMQVMFVAALFSQEVLLLGCKIRSAENHPILILNSPQVIIRCHVNENSSFNFSAVDGREREFGSLS